MRILLFFLVGVVVGHLPPAGTGPVLVLWGSTSQALCMRSAAAFWLGLAVGLLLGGGYIRWLWGGYLDYCRDALHVVIDLYNEEGGELHTNYISVEEPRRGYPNAL